MIVIDTSALIGSLAGSRPTWNTLRTAIEQDERIVVPTLVLYEWQRGPRQPTELALQEELFPSEAALPYGVKEAMLSAELYKGVRRPRGREIDLAIAATAIVRDAKLWSLNRADFSDIPGLRLYSGK